MCLSSRAGMRDAGSCVGLRAEGIKFMVEGLGFRV
jgi:hypothetical protein